MQLPSLLHNRSIQIGLGIVVVVIVLALFSAGSTPSPSLVSSPAPSSSQSFQFSNLNEEKRQRAIDYRQRIFDALPITENGYHTSVGIDTDISWTALKDDPPEQVTLEITGISYANSESNPSKNLNVQAFAESYKEAMRLIRAKNIDPQQLLIRYGSRDYVVRTAGKWISDLKLTP